MSRPFIQIRAGSFFDQVSMDQDKLTIGRAPGNRVTLADGQASRNHAVIERVGAGRYQLRDLGSSNGTKLNGERVTTSPLKAGDVILIGKTAIRFMLPADGAADEPDVLGADDLVEVTSPSSGDDEGPIGMAGDDADPMPFTTSRDDYEQGLEELAHSLPDRSFGEQDIELINARGATVHEAGAAPVAATRVGRRETVDMLRLLLLVCFRSRASDIHVEPRQEGYQARLRIDGNMVDVARFPAQVGVRLTTLVKVLSDIDIAQKNTIQEGHFATRVPSPKSGGGRRRVDYRVSFAPSVFGQKLVVRILDTANAPAKIGDLGLPSWMFQEIAAAVKQDAGMVLVSGPTGSGKTTTLYSLVRSIETSRRNVVTIEDPVEVQLEGVTQIPVDEEHDKSFSQLLRSLLRQDPDVILVGEIRDSETARIAMQAAITGHLVFSTVHTKDTVGTIFRLLDLGVEPYLVGQGLQLVLAQRLARHLCPYCKKPVAPKPEQMKAMGELASGVSKLYVPSGCPKCLGTGYAGRRAFFELLSVNDELRDLILKNPTTQDIHKALAAGKFVPLHQSAYRLVADGQVAFDEIERIVGGKLS